MYNNTAFGLMIFGSFFKLSFKYRDRTSIIGDILSSISSDPKGKTKTSIMRGANLNFDQANKYLHLLALKGLIKLEGPLGHQEIARYRLTRKGLTILREATMWRFTFK